MPLSELVVSADRLRAVAGQVAAGIGEAHGANRPLLVGVLKGAVMFLADLVRAASFDLEVDFLAISPFGPGRVRLEADLAIDVAGRHVVVVEDIVDTGLTLAYLLRTLEARRPASLEVATLLDRPARRLADVDMRWTGLEVDDRFLVGYGMDYEGRYRDLPNIHAVEDMSMLLADPDALVPELYGGLGGRADRRRPGSA